MVQYSVENEEDLNDVTQKVQDYFENAYKENSPEFIYFITLYNIFNDFWKIYQRTYPMIK